VEPRSRGIACRSRVKDLTLILGNESTNNSCTDSHELALQWQTAVARPRRMSLLSSGGNCDGKLEKEAPQCSSGGNSEA
jgi:hypothetical protein